MHARPNQTLYSFRYTRAIEIYKSFTSDGTVQQRWA